MSLQHGTYFKIFRRSSGIFVAVIVILSFCCIPAGSFSLPSFLARFIRPSCQLLDSPANNFSKKSRMTVVGQDRAINQIEAAIANHFDRYDDEEHNESMLDVHHSPLVLSFHGPSGVGKTYLYRLLWKSIYRRSEKRCSGHYEIPLTGSDDRHRRLSMKALSNIFDQIAVQVSECPTSIILLDEAQNLSPTGLSHLLTMFGTSSYNLGERTADNISASSESKPSQSSSSSSDSGLTVLASWLPSISWTDHKSPSKLIDMSRAVLVLSSNIGAVELHKANIMSRKDGVLLVDTDYDRILYEAFRSHMTPSSTFPSEKNLRDRNLGSIKHINYFIPFFPLNQMHIITIARKLIQKEIREWSRKFKFDLIGWKNLSNGRNDFTSDDEDENGNPRTHGCLPHKYYPLVVAWDADALPILLSSHVHYGELVEASPTNTTSSLLPMEERNIAVDGARPLKKIINSLIGVHVFKRLKHISIKLGNDNIQCENSLSNGQNSAMVLLQLNIKEEEEGIDVAVLRV